MTAAGRDGDEEGGGRVSLKIALGMVGYDLHDAVPDGVGYVVTGDRNELKDGIDVPAEVGGVLLGQDGDLEHHLLADGSIGECKMSDQLVDDPLGVIGVAHDKEQVEGATADGYVGILERYEDGGLVLLDSLGRSFDLSQTGHGHETEVTNIGLTDGNELAQKLHGTVSELDWPGGSPADDEVDRLEEDGMVGVGLVDGIGNVGLGQDLGNHRG